MTFARAGLIAILTATTLPTGGCVERVLQLRTDPPGATITVNGQERAGTTPERPEVEVPFLWYGNYEIIVRKEGYFTEKVLYSANPPWYQFIPVDLVVESLPLLIRDVHRVPVITLRPREGPPENEAERARRRDGLVDRAEQLRQRVLP